MPGRDVDTALRVVHDLTQSLWLGGATMGAIAIDAAASTAAASAGGGETDRLAGADRAWRRWHRVSNPAIAAHLIAGIGLTVANKGRLTAQAGGVRTTVLRSALTGVALAAEVSARKAGVALAQHRSGPPGSAAGHDEDAAAMRRRLAVAQWATVASTAAMIAVGSRMGEQQRPRELLRGVRSRLGLAA